MVTVSRPDPGSRPLGSVHMRSMKPALALAAAALLVTIGTAAVHDPGPAAGYEAVTDTSVQLDDTAENRRLLVNAVVAASLLDSDPESTRSQALPRSAELITEGTGFNCARESVAQFLEQAGRYRGNADVLRELIEVSGAGVQERMDSGAGDLAAGTAGISDILDVRKNILTAHAEAYGELVDRGEKISLWQSTADLNAALTGCMSVYED